MKSAKPLVLLVEDAPDQARLFTAYLRSQGQDLDILTCATVEKALEILSTTAPHMIILDLNLEDGSGEPVLTFAKETYPETKVLVVTGDRSDATLEKLFEMGTDDYITKPVDELIFRSKTRSILSSRYVSPMNFLGRAEGLGTLKVHSEFKIQRLDEESGTLMAPFQVLPGGVLHVQFYGVRFQFRVTTMRPVPGDDQFLLEGQVVASSVENPIEFRRALLEGPRAEIKKIAA